MSSPPLTTREYAYFSISGPGRHDAITDKLGREPSEAWSEGDPRPRGGTYQLMRWRLDSGLPDTEPLEKHIESLLLILPAHTLTLRELALDYDLFIQCVGYYAPSGHGAHLNRDVVRRAAQLGLAFDLDFYYVDDYGHDG